MSTPANMFKIIGGDGREYGPVDLATIQQWVREGRLRAESRVWESGTGAWTSAAQVPELAGMFGPPPIPVPPAAPAPPPPPPPPLSSVPPAPAAPPGLELAHAIRERGYNADIGEWFNGGWQLYKEHLGTAMGVCWAAFGILFVSACIGKIPCIGALIQLAISLAVQPPLIAGIYVTLLAKRRNTPGDVGLLFQPFSVSWLQTCLVNFMTMLITWAVALPGIILLVSLFVTGMVSFHLHEGFQLGPSASIGLVLGLGTLGALLLLLPLAYLITIYVFGIPLAADKQMSFWDAMETSRRVVNKHWFSIFGLMVVIGLINVLGVLACCVGFIFTMPLGMCIFTVAYDSIFTLPVKSESGPAA